MGSCVLHIDTDFVLIYLCYRHVWYKASFTLIVVETQYIVSQWSDKLFSLQYVDYIKCGKVTTTCEEVSMVT